MKLASTMEEDMVSVRWTRPGSVFDGVVQYVSKLVIKEIDAEGNVTVYWPQKGKQAEVWKGALESPKFEKASPRTTTAQWKTPGLRVYVHFIIHIAQMY